MIAFNYLNDYIRLCNKEAYHEGIPYFCFDTAFNLYLESKCQSNTYEFIPTVQKAIRAGLPEGISKFMFPLFSMKSYQLVVIDTEEKTVEFFDPMNPDKTTE